MTHNVAAEQAVIGGLLITPDSFDLISDILSPASFWSEANRRIFYAISSMLVRGESVDVVTVAETMERSGDLDYVGGIAHLAEIQINTPSAANIRRHAQIVSDLGVERALLDASAKIVSIVDDSGTTAEKLDQAQSLISGIAESKVMDEPTPMREALIEAITQIEERAESGLEIAGASTGLIDLDKATGGLKNGSLVIIAGRPSAGKTSLAMGMAENVGKTGVVLVFSLETSVSDLTQRMLASKARIPLDKLMSGSIDNEQWTALTAATGKLSENKVLLVDASILNVTSMRSQCRRVKRKHGLAMIVVDYLQLMHFSGDNEVTGLGEISRGLKLIAKELGVPVVALSQLNRKCEERTDKRPIMADLRASGAIEQDADLILMVYRDEVYNPDSDRKGIAEILIRKNRNGGLKDVFTTFIPEYTRFENFAGQVSPQKRAYTPKRRSIEDF